jgi:hypothetical protein
MNHGRPNAATNANEEARVIPQPKLPRQPVQQEAQGAAFAEHVQIRCRKLIQIFSPLTNDVHSHSVYRQIAILIIDPRLGWQQPVATTENDIDYSGLRHFAHQLSRIKQATLDAFLTIYTFKPRQSINSGT